MGLVTIATYGSWYYAFGVLLDPLLADTGWNEAAIVTVFGAGNLIAGLGAIAGGWLLDRLGSRVVFATAAAIAAGSFFVAAGAESLPVFALGASVGGGALGGLGFYHVTLSVAARISPSRQAGAITLVTVWGAFASVVYLPATAAMVTGLGWRPTLRLLACSAVLVLSAAAVVIPPTRPAPEPKPAPLFRLLVNDAPARRFVAAMAFAGAAVGIVLVYQVPLMTAAGLTLGSASGWAGARGLAQLGGRLPLMPVLRAIKTNHALVLAAFAIAVGALVLLFAGTNIVAASYALVAGIGIGALSPLQGIRSAELFDLNRLGITMGLVSLAMAIGGAVGPAAASVIVTGVGSRVAAALLASAAALASAAILASSSLRWPSLPRRERRHP